MTEPTSLSEVIARLTVDGQDIKAKLADAEECAAWLEAHPPAGKGAEVAKAVRDLALGHAVLNRAGYALEDACGVPEETFGAGGTSKGPGGGGG